MVMYSMNPSGWCVEGLGLFDTSCNICVHVCTPSSLLNIHWWLGTACPVTLCRNFRLHVMDVSDKRKEACQFVFGAP